jgi:hypothetical protein
MSSWHKKSRLLACWVVLWWTKECLWWRASEGNEMGSMLRQMRGDKPSSGNIDLCCTNKRIRCPIYTRSRGSILGTHRERNVESWLTDKLSAAYTYRTAFGLLQHISYLASSPLLFGSKRSTASAGLMLIYSGRAISHDWWYVAHHTPQQALKKLNTGIWDDNLQWQCMHAHSESMSLVMNKDEASKATRRLEVTRWPVSDSKTVPDR